jgi:hypothetical protein
MSITERQSAVLHKQPTTRGLSIGELNRGPLSLDAEDKTMSDELLESGYDPGAATYEYLVAESFNECPVCLGAHDEEIHAATLSVRSWFRAEVTKSFRIQPEVLI